MVVDGDVDGVGVAIYLHIYDVFSASGRLGIGEGQGEIRLGGFECQGCDCDKQKQRYFHRRRHPIYNRIINRQIKRKTQLKGFAHWG